MIAGLPGNATPPVRVCAPVLPRNLQARAFQATNLKRMEPDMTTPATDARLISKAVTHIRKPALAALFVALGAAMAPVQAQSADEAKWVPGRLLVQPRAGLSEAEFDKIIKQQGGKQVGKIDAINVRIIQLPPQASDKAVEALLKRNKHLKFAERDMLVPVDSTNDPHYSKAWHLPKIGANLAWTVSEGDGVTIAVLDTGVDGAHPDLASQMVSGWNFFDNNSNTADVHGHGTKVAGAAAASTNNSVGVAAVAGKAKIMPIRVADSSGYASFSAISQGVTWAADRGARVANISISGVAGSFSVINAAQYMKNKGGLVVAGAGNAGVDEGYGATDALISVSATTSSDVRPSWSSYGAYVDVAAPGSSIYTTFRGGSYGNASGTSFSSPVTAGVVAQMMGANPKLSPADLEKILFSTALDIGAAGKDIYYGHGRINAEAAVKAAAVATPADTAAPTVSVVSPASGSTVKGLVSVDVSATDNVGVSRVELVVNGKLVGSDTVAPYSFSWDSKTSADGATSVTAAAYDAAGNVATRSVSVTVANNVSQPAEQTAATASADLEAPVASISNPANGSRVSGNVQISANGTDNVGVTRVRLYVGGSLVSSVNGANLSYRWNTNKLAAGKYEIVAEVEDAAGNVGRQAISVTR